MTVKVGLCGFTMAASRYPLHFPVVEVQQTFYEPPKLAVLDRWRTEMPPEFEFTIKAWQLITHTVKSPTYRRLRRVLNDAERAGAGAFQASKIVDEGWETTVACATRLSATAILFQSPASFRPTVENFAAMRTFFERIVRPSGVRLLFEPRGPLWKAAVAKPICVECELVHVVDPLVHATATRGMRYFRLHGISGPRHVYSDDELRRIAKLVPKRGETYVMFNNMPRVGDAQRFQRLLGSRE
jgi:uncharacterized protein YecE (DUF72 family)